MKNSFFFSFYFLLIPIISIAQIGKINISKHPTWIQKIVPEFNSSNPDIESGGYHYLLIDVQNQLSNQERFVHYAIKVLNYEGLQSVSDISVDYDPTYETITFHEIYLIRNGKKFNKLSLNDFSIYQRETNFDRHLLDGSLTAAIHLSDVREGDIIEYSFTRKGWNQILQRRFFTGVQLEFSIPLKKFYYSIMVEKERDLFFKYNNDAEHPLVKEVENQRIYYWNKENIPEFIFDNNIPAWYDPLKSVDVTEFKNWRQFINWALPLYKIEPDQNQKVSNFAKDFLNSSHTKELQILSTIRFVQDEIRYLGFESGMSAYRPNQPGIVLERRFGDCKDKSLLLVALLRGLGLESSPILVNSNRKFSIKEDFPSHLSFNHCVVKFSFNGKDFFVDPTMTSQGGSLDNIYFPDYGYGLTINEKSNGLIKLPEPQIGKVNIKELIESIGYDKPTKFIVRSEYKGERADIQRAYFSNNSLDYVGQEYQNFYSNLYPSIKATKKINIIDQTRNSENLFIVEEEYLIDDFWYSDVENENLSFCEIYPIVLESLISFEKSSERKMPYYLGTPFGFSQETIIDLPEEWEAENEKKFLDNEVFNYRYEAKKGRKSITVKHNYTLHKSYIKADKVAEFLKINSTIYDNLSYVLSKDSTFEKHSFSYKLLSLAILATIIAILFFVWLNKNYDPFPPYKVDNPKKIGGWLILVAIGITITPFRLIYAIIDTDQFFNEAIIKSLTGGTTLFKPSLALLSLFELIYNCAFFIFSVFILIQFYQRRSSLPKLFTLYLIINLAIIVFDTIAANMILDENTTSIMDDETLKTIFRNLIAAAIWVPYFNISQRVKETFVERYANEPISQ